MVFSRERFKQIIPRRLKGAEQAWINFFETALASMLEYEMDEHRIRRAVEMSALVADEAVAQFESRWRS
jgi:hypothetical protein